MPPLLVRYCLLSFALDVQFYIIQVVIPFQALELGADPFFLGALSAVPGFFYVITAGLSGGISDRTRRLRISSVGCAFLAVGCLIEAHAESKLVLLLGTIPIGIGPALFWPAIQSGFGRLSAPGRLEANLAWFNVAWSLGKTVGYVLGGFLVQGLGVPASMAIAALLAVLVGLFAPAEGDRPAAVAAVEVTEDERARMVRFATAAWLANFASWGIGATLTAHYAKLIEGMEGAPIHFGLVLGQVQIWQTIAFVGLGRWRGWVLNARLLYAVEAAGLAAIVLLPFLAGRWPVFALTPVLGGMLGLCYASSIYYSLRAGEKKEGKYSGIHEAVLGGAVILTPLLGGTLATGLGFLPASFLLAGGTMAAVMVGQKVKTGIG